MYKVLALLMVAVGIFGGVALSDEARGAGEYGNPPAPQPYDQNPYLRAHFDVQVHSRTRVNDWETWDSPMDAQHGTACQGPPATHTVDLLAHSVFICNDHIMTSANGGGYGLIVLTPSQLADCSASCTVQFEVSTEKQSARDWWEVRLTPWGDNLTLPFSGTDVDLQGAPVNQINVSIEAERPKLTVTNNGVNTGVDHCCATFNDGIADGTNQAAVRQPFRLTVTPGRVRFERLASPTAGALLFFDDAAPVQMRNDYVVQFEHHSYNPTKDGAGVPATWHWSGFAIGPSTPFTIIKADKTLINNSTAPADRRFVFDSPAPSNALIRFSGICRIRVEGVAGGNVVPRQAFLGHPEHFSSYFAPIQAGAVSAAVSFEADDWYGTGFGCAAQDATIWSKGGAPAPTPTPNPQPSATPTVIPPSPTATFTPTATRTPAPPTATTVPPTATRTAVPPTATAVPPTPTATPTARACRVPVQQPNGSFANVTGILVPFGGRFVCVVP